MYALLAVHHPAHDKVDEVLVATRSILDRIEHATGLRGGYVGTNRARTEVFALTLWDAPGQFDAVFPVVQAEVARSGIPGWLIRPSMASKFIEMDHDA
jgi:hypothetical protein